jgi:pimeloyl-ACP methyl ester carboxylesterase
MPSRIRTTARPPFRLRAPSLSRAGALSAGCRSPRMGKRDHTALEAVRWLSALVVLCGLGAAACGSAGDDSSERSAKSRATATATPTNTDVDRAVDIGGRSLWLTCTGMGSPTVVLVHGQGLEMRSLTGVHAAASKITRTCSYDRAGQGRSDPGPRPQTIQHIVGDLFALLHAADIEPPYVLVGHSLGGPIAWAAATEHPDEVAGFLSMNGVPRASDWLPRILPRFTRNEQREERAYYRDDNDEQSSSSPARQGSRAPDLRTTCPTSSCTEPTAKATISAPEHRTSLSGSTAVWPDSRVVGASSSCARVTRSTSIKPSVVTTAISDLLEAGTP